MLFVETVLGECVEIKYASYIEMAGIYPKSLKLNWVLSHIQSLFISMSTACSTVTYT